MDPYVLSQIGSALLGIGGAAFGEWWASADDAQKRALQMEAQQIYDNMSPPELERIQAATAGDTALAGMPEDFGNKEGRNLALQQMIDMGLQGGMDAGSTLAVEQARRAAAQQEMQGRGAVQQSFQRRGLGGAGEAVLQQQAQQAGADRASVADMQAASDARARALQALATGGGMAAQAEGQDFDRAARIAQSRDAMAQFNAGQAQQANIYNSGLGQQDFQNRLGIADRQYGARQTRAGQYETEAERKRRIAGGVGQTAVGAVDKVGGYYGGKP
jgi:hypothetical protein